MHEDFEEIHTEGVPACDAPCSLMHVVSRHHDVGNRRGGQERVRLSRGIVAWR